MAKTSIACIALDGNKILVAHRNPVGQMGGRWEFPGGKVEQGESDSDAIVREFREEFGVNVTVGSAIAFSEFEHNGQTVLLHAYQIYVPHNGMETKYVLTEHTEYAWIDVRDIPQLNFVDSDLKIYDQVKDFALRNFQ
ncbi:MAG: NUDIX domain-containing protein [Treponema sp.]|nr:NUDIX domain-containing protein [Treponema sp.]